MTISKGLKNVLKLNKTLNILDYLTDAQIADVVDNVGSVDVTSAIQDMFDDITNNSTVILVPGVYLVTNTAAYPFDSTANQHVAVVNGKTNVTIWAYGAQLKMTTSDNAVRGSILLYECTNCRVLGLHGEGQYNSGSSTWTNALVGIAGASVGCELDVTITGGYAAASVYDKQFDNSGTAADKPERTKINAVMKDGRYGVEYFHAGNSHILDLRTTNVTRSLFLSGLQGLVGRVVSEGSGSDDIIIKPQHGAGISDVDLVFERAAADNQCITFQCDATAGTIERIKISGHVKCTSSSTTAVDFRSFTTTSAVVQDIDLSDLDITVTAGTTRCIFISPDVACTVRRITMPKRCLGRGHIVEIINTITATISDIVFPDGFRYAFQSGAAGSAINLDDASGRVSNLQIGVGVIDATNTSSTNVVDIRTVDGLILGKFRLTNSKTVFIRGSTQIPPANFDHKGYGFVMISPPADGANLLGVETVILPSGTTTYNSFTDVIPGQKITFVSTGGTQTFTDGANMAMAGSMTLGDGDSITFVCADDPTVGITGTAKLREVCRSDN